ncbi:DUF411 domain-containing protein [Halopseudomonas phragmitis]|uniref:Metal-binding protein n=1 Tax=Halopseudomonas phragmitis TaxID=1931241 RepID=A0A1V0B7B3_9GAMM|nr:DUF411 domain-containing protein [Halopseudomonas phragmitis]AQZ95826.1 metal-binding protein [Halopseudomonas phragmitis]
MLRALLLFVFLSSPLLAAEQPDIDVYRDPNCGCCSAWIDHLRDNGFAVRDHLESNMAAVKAHLGVPADMASCHTAVIDGRFIEGHVPAADILLMRSQPDLLGLAVPGMPIGSPGMEIGDRVDAYDVISIDQQGERRVLTSYP